MAWQDDYLPGTCDYPAEEEPVSLDPWVDPAYERTEDVRDEEEA